MRPGVGRSPTSPQNEAGLRMLPPRSEASASGSVPGGTAAAPPPELPPQVLARSYGLRVTPKTSLNVCEPAPNSGVFVFPITTAPARRQRSTTAESASVACAANRGEQNVVRTPAVSSRSLTATGTPCNRPAGSPRSAASAAASAPSASSVTTALSREFTKSIRDRCDSTTSRDENRRDRIPAASSDALIPHIGGRIVLASHQHDRPEAPARAPQAPPRL